MLTSGGRSRVWRSYMRTVTVVGADSAAFTKHDLRAAVDAVDEWVEAAGHDSALPGSLAEAIAADMGGADLRQALPAEFGDVATAGQVAALVAYVLWERAGRPLPDAE